MELIAASGKYQGELTDSNDGDTRVVEYTVAPDGTFERDTRRQLLLGK